MWIALIAPAVAAAPPGYVVVKETAGCTLSKGPADPNGVAPMHASCHWPKVQLTRLQQMLAPADGYDELIFAINVCEIVRIEGDRTLVHQIQDIKGISARETLIWMHTETAGELTRYAWNTADDEPLELVHGNVRAAQNDGYWEVSAHPEGGTRVDHHIAYSPGGSVPSWVVRWVSTGGLAQVMEEVRAKAAATM
ncbi:MAG: hypothetical protein GWP91_04630 [Rhodobacterales bacterium]|nr:hypothetical protein [Rhodobacterales bacterium]